jgi:hypothetical protein
MEKKALMRQWLLILLLSASLATDSSARLELLHRAVVELNHALSGALLLFPHRRSCPPGFRIAEEYNNRLLMVGNSEAGRVSPHTVHSPMCERSLQVAEAGFLEICRHSSNASQSFYELIPSVSMLACIRNN